MNQTTSLTSICSLGDEKSYCAPRRDSSTLGPRESRMTMASVGWESVHSISHSGSLHKRDMSWQEIQNSIWTKIDLNQASRPSNEYRKSLRIKHAVGIPERQSSLAWSRKSKIANTQLRLADTLNPTDVPGAAQSIPTNRISAYEDVIRKDANLCVEHPAFQVVDETGSLWSDSFMRVKRVGRWKVYSFFVEVDPTYAS